MSKLLESGLQWGDGTSLHAYLTSLGAPKPWARGLHEYLTADPEHCRIPALATLALELAAPLVLFFPSVRWPFFAAACGFHLVIWGLMLPEFFGQMVCYGLFVDWKRRAPIPKKAKRAPYRIGEWVPAVLLAVLLGAIVLRVDAFPVTDVPMYATRTGGSYLAGYPREEWGKLASVQEIARTFVATRRPWLANYTFARRVRILARIAGQPRPVDLTERAHRRLAPANAALWEARLSSFIAADLAAISSPSGSPEPPKDGEGVKFLRWVGKELDIADQRQVQALALVYLLDKAPPVPLAMLSAAELRYSDHHSR